MISSKYCIISITFRGMWYISHCGSIYTQVPFTGEYITNFVYLIIWLCRVLVQPTTSLTFLVSLCMCVCVCGGTELCPKLGTLWTVAYHAPLSLKFPGKNTGVDCHFFLQGFFPSQGSNPCLFCLLHWQADSLPLSHLGSLRDF